MVRVFVLTMREEGGAAVRYATALFLASLHGFPAGVEAIECIRKDLKRFDLVLRSF